MVRGVGKKVGGALYVHRSAIRHISFHAQARIEQARSLAGPEADSFNVVKIADAAVSLLLYESFDAEPFPALIELWSVDLARNQCRYRSYRHSDNPPILHRKELLLGKADHRYEQFARLTRSLEERGLFTDAHRIGWRRNWVDRLAEAGVAVADYRLIDVTTGS